MVVADWLASIRAKSEGREMSEANGHNAPKPEWMERLDRVEASHVKLMTAFEIFSARQDRAWERHEKFVAEHDKFVAEQDRRRQDQKARDEALDARIDKLVSAIGALADLR
jgi:hypothetical protein